MIVNASDVHTLRANNPGKKLVFCSGSFDLAHAGHILFFEDCKKEGDLLVVMVGGDNLLRRYKGDTRPILNEHIRIKTVDSFKPVDVCFLEPEHDSSNLLQGIEWAFQQIKPDVYVINEDASNQEHRKKLCAQYNVRIVVLPRHCPSEFENISTTSIIEKIKREKTQ